MQVVERTVAPIEQGVERVSIARRGINRCERIQARVKIKRIPLKALGHIVVK